MKKENKWLMGVLIFIVGLSVLGCYVGYDVGLKAGLKRGQIEVYEAVASSLIDIAFSTDGAGIKRERLLLIEKMSCKDAENKTIELVNSDGNTVFKFKSEKFFEVEE